MEDLAKLTIRVLIGHCLGPAKGDVYEDQELTAPGDLSIAEARRKVVMGYAEVVSSQLRAPAPIVHRDTEPVNRDPAEPAKRPVGKKSRRR
jgi:hypothetical protein